MLQQTQVATVLPYYAKFLARFPTIEDLAQASIDEVLALWAGLGYYSRARNLHRCAQQVCERHGGAFPNTLQQLQALPGIGPSTAAAIASLAQGQRAAILDGNVKRVLARHAGVIGWAGTSAVQKQLWALAHERLIDQASAATVPVDFHRRYTQGLMDLGATVCHAKKPNCALCPIASDCTALLGDTVGQIPTPRPKKITPSQSRCALVLHTAAGVWLQRRPAQGVWGGLLCLPEAADEQATQYLAQTLGLAHSGIEPANPLEPASPLHPLLPWHTHTLKHTFTHYHLLWTVWSIAVDASFVLPAPWVFASWQDLPKVGVPKAVLKVLLAD